jgi:hypothetical protein
MTKIPMLKYAAALALAGATVGSNASAEDSALIDILQRKGVLSEKEAESVRAELSRSHDSASKIKLNSSISELKLYGDLRVRYQYDSKDAQLLPSQGGGSNVSQQSRWRFRLRLNADFKLGEHVFGGVELQTNADSDSPNQSYENGFDDYSIFISKAYMGWSPTDWLTVTGGKFSNPFYTTELVWDPDINPTGAAEVIAFHKLAAGEPTVAGYSKDGKTMKEVVAPELPWELSLVAGQFIFDNNSEFNGPDYDSSTDAYLFQTQLIGSYKFNGTKVTIAPGWLTYINGTLEGVANSNPFNDNAFVSGATRNLNLLLAPGDISFKLGSLKTKIYWDFSYNIDGDARVQNIYRLANNVGNPQHTTEDDFAYLIGFQVGENKKGGDWSFLANWRQTGLGAVDPNLNDSDFGLGELNTRGVEASISYNFTDFAIGTVTYSYAWNLRDSLTGGEVTGGNAIGDSNDAQLLQVDLNVKF